MTMKRSALGLAAFQREIAKDDTLRDYLRQLKGVERPSAAEEKRLGGLALAGDKDARAALVVSHMMLPVDVAINYAGLGLAAIDLIMSGNEGLLVAVDRYDPARRNRFTSIATPWVRACIVRALATSDAVRLPYDLWTRKNRLQKVTSAAPSIVDEGELAAAANMTRRQVARIRATQLARPLSLDIPDPDQEYLTLGDNLPDPASENIGERLESDDMKAYLARKLASLPEKLRYIIQLHFGIGVDREYTRAEIGERLGISGERVRQYEDRALAMLRDMMNDDEIRGIAAS